VPVKTALLGEGGVDFAAALAAALPPCQAGQESIALDGRLIRCIAGDSSVDEVAAQIVSALPAVLDNAPDRIILNEAVNLRQSWRSLDWFLGAALRFGLDTAILTLILASLSIAVVAAFLAGRDQRGRLQWLGVSLLVPALMFVMLGLTISVPSFESLLRRELLSASWYGPQYSETFRFAAIDLGIFILRQIASGFLQTAVPSCLAALGLLIWGWRADRTDPATSKLIQVPVRNT
jgi:hypothetical protein